VFWAVVGGRERWMTLGNYPDMSLAAAQIEAREKRLMLDKRRDPPTRDVSSTRRCRGATSINTCCRPSASVYAPRCPRPMPSGSSHKSKSAPTAANDLLRFMRRVFRFGVRRHGLTSNPVADGAQPHGAGWQVDLPAAISQR